MSSVFSVISIIIISKVVKNKVIIGTVVVLAALNFKIYSFSKCY